MKNRIIKTVLSSFLLSISFSAMAKTSVIYVGELLDIDFVMKSGKVYKQ